MKTRTFLSLTFIALLASLVWAQPPRRGRWGGMRYDPATEVTVTGKITEVKKVEHRGMMTGLHVMLETEKGTLDVHLGPAPFLEKSKMTFEKGEEMEVTGSKTKYDGSDAIIAREVKKAGQVLTLRDSQGIPKWSRGRRTS
ncbi:MAG: hypothetical protein IT165_02665 [Bryobacterales bacterium]|nr:hypothetical protein [Bryobacterales bacterium]